MPKIFISYRRDDSEFQSHFICKELRKQFDADSIFMDVDTIPLGVDFRRHLNAAVQQCDVLLAIIGSQWLDIRLPGGQRRLDEPRDFVRIEIEAALSRGIPVIPVLLGRVSMPGEEHLPSSISEIAYRQNVVLRSGRDFDSDVERLIRGIKSHFQPGRVPNVEESKSASFVNSIGMKLALIPAGSFLMGSPDADRDAFADEKPQHMVEISRPFYLGVFPVTQAEYQKVTGDNPSRFQGNEIRPVENVSWWDAIEFCNKLSKLEGRSPYYVRNGDDVTFAPGNGYRLPTEAEWEYACRSGTTTKRSCGDDETRLHESAWFSANSGGETLPVGEKKPNLWGLFDMHGNVWEWCGDWHADYASQRIVDPQGPPEGSDRVLRGGCWIVNARYVRSACRSWVGPGSRDVDLGFRLLSSASPVQ